MRKSILIVLGIYFATIPAWGQSTVVDKSIEEHSLTGTNFYGQSIIPFLLLPGFLPEDPEERDYGYPIFNDSLKGGHPLDMKQRNLAIEQTEGKILARAKPVAITKVLVLSVDLIDYKEFDIENPLVGLVVISDNELITELSVNGKDISFATELVVETELNLSLKDGLNDVIIEGKIAGGDVFSKHYKVLYKEKITEGSVRSWQVVVNIENGYNTNINGALDKGLAIGRLGNIYAKSEKADSYASGRITVVDEIGEDIDWYVGGGIQLHTKKENKNENISLAYGALSWEKDEILSRLSVSNFITESKDSYTSVVVGASYDLDYIVEPHSGTIIGANYVTNFLKDGDKGTGKELFVRYNGFYLAEWINLTVFNASLGDRGYGDLDKDYNFYNFGVDVILNRTSWDLNASLGVDHRVYKEQHSLDMDNPDSMRNDFSISASLRYSYFLMELLDIYASAASTTNFSNYSPYKNIVVAIGTNYIY
ncbi:MAG: hypothetical protein JJV97_06420 [SAR324 cluster bacterium]|nr:hypothetical protein [SAR324 cluster bacterium]